MPAQKDTVYLIIELNTGALDGFYFDRELATGAYESISATYQGRWVLTELLEQPEECRLPDDRFWTEIFP